MFAISIYPYGLQGFGHALATQLGQLGAVVFAGCLHGNGEGAKKLKALKLANLHVLQMDVTKADQVTKSSLEVASKLEGKSGWLSRILAPYLAPPWDSPRICILPHFVKQICDFIGSYN